MSRSPIGSAVFAQGQSQAEVCLPPVVIGSPVTGPVIASPVHHAASVVTTSCHQCQNLNFRNEMVTFCRGADFTDYVRKAINDEMYWRDVFSRFNVASEIESKLDRKLPEHVRNEIASQLPAIFQARMDSYMLREFPALAAKEVHTRVDGYVNNNQQMREILANHRAALTAQFQDTLHHYQMQCATLKAELEKTVHDTMRHIVSDPGYNEILATHLATIEGRANTAIADINKKADTAVAVIDANGVETIRTIVTNAGNQIAANGRLFAAQLNECRDKTDNTISGLKRRLDDLDEVSKKVRILETALNNTQNHLTSAQSRISNLQWLIGAIVVIPAAAYFLLLNVTR